MAAARLAVLSSPLQRMYTVKARTEAQASQWQGQGQEICGWQMCLARGALAQGWLSLPKAG